MIKIGKWYLPDHDASKFSEDQLSDIERCENSILNRAFSYVKKFENAIDVGAWIGDTTYPIAKKFKNVIAFEANPEVYECLDLNVNEHQLTNCQLVPLGLSNRAGEQYFLNKTRRTNSGWISTVELPPEEKTSAKVIKTVTLDSYNYRDIDFIKIDVDSHEGFLLEGAREFFKNNSPVLQIEIKTRSHYRQNSDMPDAFKLLESLNYKVVESIGKADYIFLKS